MKIAITSGKGGTGKTTVSTGLFHVLTKYMEYNVQLLDCDVEEPDCHIFIQASESSNYPVNISIPEIDTDKCTFCGKCKNACAFNAIVIFPPAKFIEVNESLCKELCRFDAISIADNEIHINEFACEGCGLCSIACPAEAIKIVNYNKNHIYFADCRFGPMIYGKLGIAEENSGKLVSKIRQYANDTARKINSEMIITDGPPGIGCPVISSVTGADLVIAVTEPTISGLHDLDRLISLIGQFHTTVQVIINKYDLNSDMTKNIENNLIDKGITILGRIPYDESMVYALLEGRTINEFEPDGVIANILNEIWNNIKI